MSSHHHEDSIAERVEHMLRPERMEKLDPFVVLSLCPINFGDTVADIGCGPGYFTLPLAKQLVHGKVYALDVDREMVDICRERVEQARMGNVEVLECQDYEFPTPEAGVDGLLVAFVVHHTPDQARFLSAIRGLLKSRGWCSILEWQPTETETGPPLAHRIAPEAMRDLAQGAGFRVQGWRPLNDDYYMMTLRNP